MLRVSRAPWTALVALVTLWFALGCGGYTISIQPPPVAGTEVVADAEVPSAPVAPVPVASAPKPGTAAPKPAPAAPKPAPAPAPAPAKRGSGQIQVTTAAAVQAMVDGVPMPFTTSQGYVMDVTSGTHQLEIYNLLGAVTASQSVDVPSGQRVMFAYKPKVLTQGATVPASAVPVPEPVYIPEPAPVLPGSVEITGLAMYNDAVFVDGYSARYDSRLTSYIASGLSPGQHELRVEIDRQVVYSGLVDVSSGENHRCLASWDGWAWNLDCHWTRPAL